MSDSALARAAFHDPHLLRVSRSFAYGIGRLRPTLRADVGLGYLLCRLLDTVEDASWPIPAQQLAAFESFNQFLKARPAETAVLDWARSFPVDVPEGERELLNASARVFSEFHSLPMEKRDVLKRPILSMSAGMKFFTERTRTTGRLRLASLTEANAYCLFVAGVVGELLTGLLNLELEASPQGLVSGSLKRETFVDGCHFGLFLQKINILKDQHLDEQDGRSFISDRNAMLATVKTHADHAIRYLLSIPLERSDYRLFCAWALYLGLATMPLLEAASGDKEEAPKLSRTRALALGAKIEFAIGDDQKLKSLYTSLIAESSALSDTDLRLECEAPAQAEHVLSQTLELYDGVLSPDELAAILTVR